jgi:hypothetical protein
MLSQLQEIHFWGNEVGDETSIAFVEALKTNSNLLRLQSLVLISRKVEYFFSASEIAIAPSTPI